MSAPEVLFSAAEIQDRIDALAETIAADLGEDIVAVPVMTGAMVFAADLIRALWRRGVAVELMALRIRSYGASLSAENAPVIAMPLDKRIDGRTALLIDGLTSKLIGKRLGIAVHDHLVIGQIAQREGAICRAGTSISTNRTLCIRGCARWQPFP